MGCIRLASSSAPNREHLTHHYFGAKMDPSIHFGSDMATLSIKDVPDTWAEALRQRAARNHRSLQGELMALVEKAVIESSPVSAGAASSQRTTGTSQEHVGGLDRFGDPIIRRGSKTVEEIAAEHRKRFPKPISGGALAADIVRADRDTR
jgi:plasmid stability protein